MFLFKYKVRFYDNMDNKYELAEGYVFGIDEPDAIKNLAQQYRFDKVEISYIDEVSVPVFETLGWIASQRHEEEIEMEKRPW